VDRTPFKQAVVATGTRGVRGLLHAVLLLGGLAAGAQTLPPGEHEVKTGFIYNFIKFTQWPASAEAARAPLRLCSTGARPLQGQLALLQDQATSAGRVIEIVPKMLAANARQCDVLFLTAGDEVGLDALLRSLERAPVLTVGDLPGFVHSGGMIGLRIEANRVRFDVNLAAAQRNGLLLNSQMLRLAGKVVQ